MSWANQVGLISQSIWQTLRRLFKAEDTGRGWGLSVREEYGGDPVQLPFNQGLDLSDGVWGARRACDRDEATHLHSECEHVPHRPLYIRWGYRYRGRNSVLCIAGSDESSELAHGGHGSCCSAEVLFTKKKNEE